MIDDRTGRLVQLPLGDFARELHDHAARQPTLEQLEREFAGLTDAQERARLERLIAYLRRADASRQRT